MRRILSQVIILVLFLFLTVFASVWFEDTGGDENVETTRPQSILWFSKAAQKTWQIIDGLAGIAVPSSSKPVKEDSQASVPAIEVASDLDEFTQDLGSMAAASTLDSFNSDGNFRQFLGNFFSKTPSLYFDTKVYSNGWRNFWSLYWLEYNNLRPEQP
ncbi:MAG: hypothetical protein PHG95_01155 [Patescibacteria group bacterium]|nr:hypothetical protein [Patescibacteria group bacterium]